MIGESLKIKIEKTQKGYIIRAPWLKQPITCTQWETGYIAARKARHDEQKKT